MSQKKLEIFNLSQYQERPLKGIFVDAHNEFIKISPAEYTGYSNLDNKCIPKREIYEAIVKAEEEAKALSLNKVQLPIGLDTHKIDLAVDKLGLLHSYRINIILNLSYRPNKLVAFNELVEKYNTEYFLLGRAPFHSNQTSQAIKQIVSSQYYARISSIFRRKRDFYPRVYIGIALNSVLFGLRPTTNIDIEDFSEEYTASPSTQRVDIDL